KGRECKVSRVFYTVIVSILTISLLIPTSNSSAESIEDYKQKIEGLEEEKGSLNDKKDKVNEEKDTVQKEKGSNKKEQNSVEEQMEKITKKVDGTEKKIKDKKKEKEKIKEREKMLSSRLQSIQENGGEVKFIEVILGAKNFSELITRSSAVNTVMDSDKAIMEEHLADQKALETKEEQVKSNKQSLET